MIVWAMNGEPLPNIHGGPVRLIYPGWAGSASQKWLTQITLRDKEHDGPGMTEFSYRVAINPMVPGDKADPKNFRILESMPVRSLITSPANGAKLAAGTRELKLRGAAWAGDLAVQPVDVSTDFGATWSRAEARKPKNRYDWQRWTATVKLPSGRLFRGPDARHRLQRRDATASGGLLESAGLRRQRDAPRSRCWSPGADDRLRLRPALRWPLLWIAPGGSAQTGFTPRDENPEDFPAGPDAPNVLHLHRLPRVQAVAHRASPRRLSGGTLIN